MKWLASCTPRFDKQIPNWLSLSHRRRSEMSELNWTRHTAHKRLDRYTDYRTPVRVRLLCTNMQYRPRKHYRRTAWIPRAARSCAREKESQPKRATRGFARRGRINPSNDGNKWLALGAPRTIIMAEHFLYLCFKLINKKHETRTSNYILFIAQTHT